MFLTNSPGLPRLQPCFHGPLGALRLFSSTCGSWAFISSFQDRTRPGPGLPCAQEAWGLSPAAPGGPHVSPTQARQRSRGWPSRGGGCRASQDKSVLRQQPDQT